MQHVTDPDVQILAALATAIAPDYLSDADDPWLDSPFGWIRNQPSRSIGAIGENLVAGWAAAKGFDVVRPKNSQADRINNGHRIEKKFSTLWKSADFKFQQMRDQDYDFALCIGILPFDAHAWLLSKQVLREYVIGHMGQHTGAAGVDTSWISFKANNPFKWMEPFGGRLSDVAQLIESHGRGPY